MDKKQKSIEVPEGWKKVESMVLVARGAKKPWFKVQFVRPDGTVLKFAMKQVREFWDEQDALNDIE